MLGYGFTPRQGYVPQPNLQIKTFFDLNKVLKKQSPPAWTNAKLNFL